MQKSLAHKHKHICIAPLAVSKISFSSFTSPISECARKIFPTIRNSLFEQCYQLFLIYFLREFLGFPKHRVKKSSKSPVLAMKNDSWQHCHKSYFFVTPKSSITSPLPLAQTSTTSHVSEKCLKHVWTDVVKRASSALIFD